MVQKAVSFQAVHKSVPKMSKSKLKNKLSDIQPCIATPLHTAGRSLVSSQNEQKKVQYDFGSITSSGILDS